MAVINERAVVSVFDMLGRTVIQLPKVLGGLNFDQQIQKLFSNGEQGFFYDPNDLSTMFQDAAGTVPVTGAGQPVGLMLDKSKGLLIGNETISDAELNNAAYWTATANVAVSNGVATFTNATTAQALISPNGITSLNQWYEIEIFVDSITSGQLIVAETGGSISSVLLVGLNKVKILANGIARSLRVYALGTTNAVISKFSAKPITGNHAYQTTSAARPILRKNATTGANYLEFDGSDDFLVTNSIDFTATDKVSLFAGVRKYANSVRVLCELSSDMNANAGSFYLTAPENGQGQYGFKARANANQHASMTALTQNTSIDDICVLSASSDLSSDRNTIRRNGVFSSINYELGGGNYGNYPIYIGRRAGTSLPFNGHIYGLIGVGKLASDNETVAIEKELAKRIGVTLNV